MRFISTLVMLALPLMASALEWLPFDEALKEGKEKKKFILLLITADAEFSNQMEKDIFSKEPFARMSEGLVLAKFKIGANADQLTEAVMEVIKSSHIQYPPTVVLLDRDGRIVGMMQGYPDAIVDDPLDGFDRMIKSFKNAAEMRDMYLAQAEQETAPEKKMKLISNALEALSKYGGLFLGGLHGYEKEINQVIELDKDNADGKRAFWELYLIIDRYRLGKEDPFGPLDAFVEKYRESDKHQAQVASVVKAELKFDIFMSDGQFSQQEAADVLALLQNVIDIDEGSPVAAVSRDMMKYVKDLFEGGE